MTEPDKRSIDRFLLQGWVSVAIWMSAGLFLEVLLGFKTPGYLQDELRRELFRLAHAHGTLLGLLLLGAAFTTDRLGLPVHPAARIALQVGAAVMPFGFLLAGIWHSETDPGFAIWLVPVGAVLVIFGAVSFAFAVWKNRQ